MGVYASSYHIRIESHSLSKEQMDKVQSDPSIFLFYPFEIDEEGDLLVSCFRSKSDAERFETDLKKTLNISET